LSLADSSPQPGLQRLSSGIRNATYLRKWLILGTLIGVVAGLGAIAFTEALDGANHLLLGSIAGYHVPLPFGEGNEPSSTQASRLWAMPIVVAAGGLLSGIFVSRVAPEAAGHGTDAATEAVHHNPTGIRPRVSVVKIISSALTIGSGGSGGREGPTAQISSSFASFLARRLDLTPADARIALTVGMGAGIGAIFRAPLGGAVLGAEILYREDVESEALIPSLIASIIGFAVFGAVEGFVPIFGYMQGYRFNHPVELIYFALIGLAAGVLGMLYSGVFYKVHHFAESSRLSGALKPAIGGLLVGLMALVLPQVLGTGYGWVQEAMTEKLLTIPLWIILLLPFAKIVSTSLSIGSGGSGGIFGPGMVIGGFLGAAVWRLLQGFAPGLPVSPAPLVIVGMISCFGSIAHAPIAVMLMVAEMTGSLELLAPAMAAVGIATLVVGDHTIYASQLKSRADSPSHRLRFGLPMLDAISVSESMTPPKLVLDGGHTVSGALIRLGELDLRAAPVVGESNLYLGVVAVEELENAPSDSVIRTLADRTYPVAGADAKLDSVMSLLADGHANWLPVVTSRGKLVGTVATANVVRAYQKSLETARRRLLTLSGSTVLLDERVGAGSAAAGSAIRDVPWPPGTLVIAVGKKDSLVFPTADTRIEPGDTLSILTSKGSEAGVRRSLRGSKDLNGGGGPELI
jgi:CIC family chloride channel protein